MRNLELKDFESSQVTDEVKFDYYLKPQQPVHKYLTISQIDQS